MTPAALQAGLDPARLDAVELAGRGLAADRLLEAEGAGHRIQDWAPDGTVAAPRWTLDPVPYVIDADEFDQLAAAAVERMTVIERVLADCYGPRRLVAERVIAAGELYAAPQFRPTDGGAGMVRRWLTGYAVDVVRDVQGTWHVVDDITDAPNGLGYALLNRSVLARVMGQMTHAVQPASVHDFLGAFRRALGAVSHRPGGRVAVLTSGLGDRAYVEHSYLAARMGYHLVEAGDLVMREGRLWLRSIDQLEPIDVLYRRIEDGRVDPMESHHVGGGAGVPGVVWGARRGGVALANAYGSGLGEATVIRDALAAAAPILTGAASPSLGMWHHQVPAATAPCLVGDRVVDRAVVVRLQVAAGGGDHVVMRGGVGRVHHPADDLRTARSRRAKDVGVVGRVAPIRVTTPSPLEQVDFGHSLAKRVADGLYSLGSAGERVERLARAWRVLSLQAEQDPSLVGSLWEHAAHRMLGAATGAPGWPVPFGAAQAALEPMLGELISEAAGVREYLSASTGRVMARLSAGRNALRAGRLGPDDVDGLLVDLAAFAGLTDESMVRGPGWLFLELGRRSSRALGVIDGVHALRDAAGSDDLAIGADNLLAANESLVAYRRRYRSEVDPAAVVHLLVRDPANPRGVAFQVDRLAEYVATLRWVEGCDVLDQARAALDRHDTNGLGPWLAAIRAPIERLRAAVSERWFLDPVHPTVVGWFR